jgi:predicted RNA binding protein YcfA (HicA-like mRNA interferase family)
MPAKTRDLQKAAKKLGFQMVRQKGSHADGSIPMAERLRFQYMAIARLETGLFYEILKQLGITEEDFCKLLE